MYILRYQHSARCCRGGEAESRPRRAALAVAGAVYCSLLSYSKPR